MTDDTCRKMVSDEEVTATFKGTNFGNCCPREIIADTLLKIAGAYSTGYTSIQCCKELGLLGKHGKTLTKKGGRYMYHAYQAAWNTRAQTVTDVMVGKDAEQLKQVRDAISYMFKDMEMRIDIGGGSCSGKKDPDGTYVYPMGCGAVMQLDRALEILDQMIAADSACIEAALKVGES